MFKTDNRGKYIKVGINPDNIEDVRVKQKGIIFLGLFLMFFGSIFIFLGIVLILDLLELFYI